MSWWVYLECPTCRKPVTVDRHEGEGGTYVVGGSSDAEVNVTYNYGRHFAFRDELDGKTAAETTPVLRAAAERLGSARSDDYWEPSEGNAGHAVGILLRWAEQHPSAVWRVS